MPQHVDEHELLARLAACPAPGPWRHRRSGADVRVVGGVLRESTLEPEVAYRHGGVTFTRPLAEFRDRFEAVAAVGGDAACERRHPFALALQRLVRAVDAIDGNLPVVRELSRAGLASELAAACGHAARVLAGE